MSVYKFSEGNAEDYIEFRFAFDDLCVRKGITEDDPKRRHALLQSLMGGTAHERYTKAYNKVMAKEEYRHADLDDDIYKTALAEVLNKFGQSWFPGKFKKASKVVKKYIRSRIKMRGNLSPRKVYERTAHINEGLKYYPYPDGGSPPEPYTDEYLREIIDGMKPDNWDEHLMYVNKDTDDCADIDELMTELDVLHMKEQSEINQFCKEDKLKKSTGHRNKDHEWKRKPEIVVDVLLGTGSSRKKKNYIA